MPFDLYKLSCKVGVVYFDIVGQGHEINYCLPKHLLDATLTQHGLKSSTMHYYYSFQE